MGICVEWKGLFLNKRHSLLDRSGAAGVALVTLWAVEETSDVVEATLFVVETLVEEEGGCGGVCSDGRGVCGGGGGR